MPKKEAPAAKKRLSGAEIHINDVLFPVSGVKKSRREYRAGPSPPLPWEPYFNLHDTCRWVASLLFLRFQRPGTVKAAPGGLRFAGEYGIPY